MDRPFRRGPVRIDMVFTRTRLKRLRRKPGSAPKVYRDLVWLESGWKVAGNRPYDFDAGLILNGYPAESDWSGDQGRSNAVAVSASAAQTTGTTASSKPEGTPSSVS